MSNYIYVFKGMYTYICIRAYMYLCVFLYIYMAPDMKICKNRDVEKKIKKIMHMHMYMF
jgi:hypothetical protein